MNMLGERYNKMHRSIPIEAGWKDEIHFLHSTRLSSIRHWFSSNYLRSFVKIVSCSTYSRHRLSCDAHPIQRRINLEILSRHRDRDYQSPFYGSLRCRSITNCHTSMDASSCSFTFGKWIGEYCIVFLFIYVSLCTIFSQLKFFYANCQWVSEWVWSYARLSSVCVCVSACVSMHAILTIWQIRFECAGALTWTCSKQIFISWLQFPSNCE